MLRLSRARIIQDIERLVGQPPGCRGEQKWTVRGVACARTRHSFSGASYGFDLDVLRVASRGWEILIVTEFWRDAQDRPMQHPKWLKLISGSNKDVLRWLADNRDALASD